MFPSSDVSFSPSSLFSAYVCLTGFLMLFRSMLNDFVPARLRSYFAGLLERFFTPKSKNLTLVVDEFFGFNRNQVYDAAEIYLRSKISPNTERLRVGKLPKQQHFTISIEKGEEIYDCFEGSEVKWSYYVQSEKEKGDIVKRYYVLTFEKRLREKIMDSYLSYVVKESEEIKRNLRVVKLYSRDVDANERIVVFTTNHKERLDPALLRPGRMDMHINMSYCTGSGFRILVSNYLGLDGLNHPLYEEIQELIDSTEVTPAELAEELMQENDTDVVLRGVMSFVEKRKLKISEAKKGDSLCKVTDDVDEKHDESFKCVQMKNAKTQTLLHSLPPFKTNRRPPPPFKV